MGPYEVAVFLFAGAVRVGFALWILEKVVFDRVALSTATTGALIAQYLFAELIIRGLENWLRYHALLVQFRMWREKRAAEERAREEARLRLVAAQQDASAKYFDVNDFKLGKRHSAT
jgi:hypothetical protein